MKKYLLLLTLLLLSTTICRAQNETANNHTKLFNVSGQLKDSLSQAPILNATVSLITVHIITRWVYTN